MDNYGTKMIGKFFCQNVATLPSWTSADEGRFIYTNDTDKVYYGTAAKWSLFGGGTSEVEVRDSGHALSAAVDAGKLFTCNSTSDQTFTLPSVGAGDVSIEFSFVKLGTGKLIITAADSDTIEDSGPGLTLYCEDSGFASITIKLISTTQWIILNGATGTWITTV